MKLHRGACKFYPTTSKLPGKRNASPELRASYQVTEFRRHLIVEPKDDAEVLDSDIVDVVAIIPK